MSDSKPSRMTPQAAAEAFVTPPRPTEVESLAPGATSRFVPTPQGKIALHYLGEGPRVLLLPGWEGQASDMSAFATPLLEAGMQVIAMDLPAHGQSEGTQTSIPQSAIALKAVGDHIGPLRAVVAHSIGCAVLCEAMHAGLKVSQAVLIGGPAYFDKYVKAGGRAMGLDEAGVTRMLELLNQRLGISPQEVSVPARATSFTQPALFIHSDDDQVVPIEDSLINVSAWKGAKHMRVEGLGHRRILRDPAVVAAALAHVVG